MKNLIKTLGFLLVFCAVHSSWAAMVNRSSAGATGRPGATDSRVSISANTAAMRRLPTLLKSTTTTTTSSSSSSDSSLLTMNECVEQYTDCIKDSDVCGNDFEECTTTPLFHAKKPQCNGVLLQCGADGINALFGTSDTTAFSDKNGEGEDATFIYPTAGSILGQLIEGGHINNLYDTATCVKRVTSCLHKENVCGPEFELCTSNTEFKKQKVFCESNFARCQSAGIMELFGSTDSSSNPTTASRLGVLIEEGADLATKNAVSTCYKVGSQCILSACKANPYKCINDSSLAVADITDAIVAGRNSLSQEELDKLTESRTSSMVGSFIRGACMDTIGGSKYCHMTVNGSMPKASQLVDEEKRSDVFADIYPSLMNVDMRGKIQDLADEFDRATKDKCTETIMSCAMRSCGSGLGSACFKLVYGASGNTRDMTGSINGKNTYYEIQRGCEAIVNTDANCQYAAAVAGEKTYGYTYNDADTFVKLFPNTNDDPIGVIERLNAALAENYNDAAIAKLKQDCRNTAISCIRSMCGSDFTGCYRNRTDVMTDTYSTSTSASNSDTNSIDEGFANSMNKVGGVLDFTIVRGLCINAVKEASSCDEHLKLEAYSMDDENKGETVWGTSVRDSWVDAVKTGYSAKPVTIEGEFVETGLCTIDTSKTNNPKCKSKTNEAQECNTVDEDGCIYDLEQVVARQDYQLSMAANTLFQEVLGDLELEAQALYNQKLTKEQNMCRAANSGGIMGRNDIASTYMWVKLKSRKVPKNYSTAGLKVNDFVASNDLYGSFCRARVTIQSDDPDIQSALQSKNNNWSTAYFAVGDVFTCGSWIPQDKLQAIASRVACSKAKKAGTIPSSTNCANEADVEKVGLTTGQKWAVAAATIGSAGVGVAAMDLLQTKTGLGGLLNTANNSSKNKISENAKQSLQDSLTSAENAYRDAGCGVSDPTGVICREHIGTKANFETYKYKKEDSSCTPPYGISSCSVLSSYLEEIRRKLGVDENGEETNKVWKNGLGRGVVDSIGAVALGTTGFLATRNNIRESNRQKFSAEEEAFMNAVGDHIYCFIGADEAGTYGDLIEISLE